MFMFIPVMFMQFQNALILCIIIIQNNKLLWIHNYSVYSIQDYLFCTLCIIHSLLPVQYICCEISVECCIYTIGGAVVWSYTVMGRWWCDVVPSLESSIVACTTTQLACWLSTSSSLSCSCNSSWKVLSLCWVLACSCSSTCKVLSLCPGLVGCSYR